jgi:glycosyltransferase involved in cell wall biosynthesis
MWAYLVRYPGLVVLHDARLHHARARHLLEQKRPDDYRRELRYDHPTAPADAAEYAVEGLSGSIYYFWSMLRAPMLSARLVAVHNPRVAADLAAEYPGVSVESIRMGVEAFAHDEGARARICRLWKLPEDGIVFAAFGKVTREKRIAAMLDALATLRREGADAWLLLVGDARDYPTLDSELARSGVADRVRVAGHVPDEEIGAYLSAADACLCLRWPTALETSASWLRCLAARRATVISDLAHLADIPPQAALRVDVDDETRGLTAAMRALAADPQLRDTVARGGFDYFTAHHTLDLMASDYRRLIARAAARPAPAVAGLPAHFTADHGDAAREVARQFGVVFDLLD